ncbi:alpha/beta hydrolase [Paenibacillus campi]|uniref:alpha/beta hydrolase n=1 Tax=Paenibacillus campi TaxID=3106031 RepID=UPI002AFE4CD9|nr:MULTISPECIES: alpha/beta fold hydrolase [unclassified Paenibacillus]
MKMVTPQSFTYKAGSRAVLLLHGYTGSTIHVRRLGRYLHEHGYTCHAPLYAGHGDVPELLLHTRPAAWWQSVVDGYDALQQQGYEEIAVAGVSLGGVFTLRLATLFPVKAVISMSAPVQEKSTANILQRVLDYARWYVSLETKDTAVMTERLERLAAEPLHELEQLRQLISSTAERLHRITAPALIMQGEQDDALYQNSARTIYEQIGSKHKQLKWYPASGHILPMDVEYAQVCTDIHQFLDTLDWKV